MLMRIALPVCLTIAAVSPAFAEALIPYGTSGNWQILRDPTHGNGCLAQTALSDGTFLRIGFEKPGSGKGYIASFNPAWSTIDMRKKYDVKVTFGKDSFVGEGRGAKLGDVPGIEAKTNNVDMLVALGAEKSVNLSADGGPGIDVALVGSRDALAQAVMCQSQ